VEKVGRIKRRERRRREERGSYPKRRATLAEACGINLQKKKSQRSPRIYPPECPKKNKRQNLL
jgi:hypothetical protein